MQIIKKNFICKLTPLASVVPFLDFKARKKKKSFSFEAKCNFFFFEMLGFTNLFYELKALETFSGMYFQNKLCIKELHTKEMFFHCFKLQIVIFFS